MHWMGPYVIQHITEAGVVQLKNLVGTSHEVYVNESKMKLYRDNQAPKNSM